MLRQTPTPHELGPVLSAYLDDELGREARSRVSAHLAECRGCHRELDQLQVVKAGLAAIRPPPVAVPGRAKLLSSFRLWRDQAVA